MRRKRRSAFGYGVLAALALAGLVWIWWQASQEFGEHRGPPPVLVRPLTVPEVKRGPESATNQGAITGPAPMPQPLRTNLAIAVNPAQPSAVTLNRPAGFPRPVRDVFECQLALARQALSPGSLDGAMGRQTRAAIRAFQEREQLPATGELDAPTRELLLLEQPPMTTYLVTAEDVARLQPLASTWLGKSEQTALEYETILELVAEKSKSHPDLIRQLNPRIDWHQVTLGTALTVPQIECPDPAEHAAFLVIRLGEKTLEAFDAATNLLAHFPCSIARQVEKRPIGELHVAVIAPHPNYTFNPEIFPESAEARHLPRLVLPPGPNNPVGVAWIGLDRPGYGIHGTPQPEQVGRTESHGCFRLANWNAEYLLKLVTIGTPVRVVP